MAMNSPKLISILLILLLVTSCGSKDNRAIRSSKGQPDQTPPANIPLDKGFSEYISGYTSGIIPANSSIEIRFNPGFAAKADKSTSGSLFLNRLLKAKQNGKMKQPLYSLLRDCSIRVKLIPAGSTFINYRK
jgi:hypothetical protein